MTKGSYDGVLLSLEKNLTYHRQHRQSSRSICAGTEYPVIMDPVSHSAGEPLTKYHERHGRLPSPSPQSTCEVVGQTCPHLYLQAFITYMQTTGTQAAIICMKDDTLSVFLPFEAEKR